MTDFYLKVRLRLETLWAAIRALKALSNQKHHEASEEKRIKERNILHKDGDYLDNQAKEIRDAMIEALRGKDE